MKNPPRSLFTQSALAAWPGPGWARVARQAALFLAAATGSGMALPGAAQPISLSEIWTTPASGNTLEAVAYGAGTFVAVGEPTLVATSTNGVCWHVGSLGTTDVLHGVVWGKGLFVAVGTGGRVFTSTDTLQWTSRQAETAQNLYRVAYGNGSFVAVGAGGTILTSPHGAGWIRRRSGTSLLLSGLIFGGGTFVAVGEGGVILTSRDTVRWKGKKSPSAGFHDAVGYGQGGFVIVGEDILTSSDGTLWRPRAPSERLGLSAITWGRNKFVAISGRGGMTWGECMERVPLGLPGHCYFEAVTFGAGIFVAVGWHGADAAIATSEDGINWRQSLSSNLVMPMPPHPVSLF